MRNRTANSTYQPSCNWRTVTVRAPLQSFTLPHDSKNMLPYQFNVQLRNILLLPLLPLLLILLRLPKHVLSVISQYIHSLTVLGSSCVPQNVGAKKKMRKSKMIFS